MVLHFVVDEKVTDQIIENFNKVDKTNFFLVFSSTNKEPFKYIKSTTDKLIRYNYETDDINAVIKKLQPSVILTHAFHLEYAKTIIKINSALKIAWYIWGFDVYGLPKIKPSTYAPNTDQYLLKTIPELKYGRFILKHSILRKLYFSLKKEDNRYSIIYKALNKVNYFVTYLEGDFKHYSKHYKHNFEFVNCPFSTIDQYLAGNKELTLKENASNILIGNSNSPESNHIDAFALVNKYLDLSKINSIYVPLSYGDDNKYRDFVIEKGNILLQKPFVPMLEFMNRADYIEMLRSCSVGIFYHYRQQAMGNIIAMLYLGSRVYLSRINPAYDFFVDNKIMIFDLDKDLVTFKNKKLEEIEILENRKKLDIIFNEERVFKEMTELIKKIS